jgi:predicted dehydrogenase
MRGFYDPDVIGGPMLDLHVHDAHFIRLICGMPTRVHATGRMHGEVVQYFNSQFSFADPELLVTATAGVIDQPARSFLHGYEIHLERATLVFEFAVIDDQPRQLMPCTVLPARGRARQPALGEGDPMAAFAAELTQVIRAVRTGELPAFLSAELARDAIELCHRQTMSVRKGTSVKVSS